MSTDSNGEQRGCHQTAWWPSQKSCPWGPLMCASRQSSRSLWLNCWPESDVEKLQCPSCPIVFVPSLKPPRFRPAGYVQTGDILLAAQTPPARRLHTHFKGLISPSSAHRSPPLPPQVILTCALHVCVCVCRGGDGEGGEVE